MKIKSVLFNTDSSKVINTSLNLRYSYNTPMSYPEYDIPTANNAFVCYVSDKINNNLEIEVNIDDFPDELHDKWITIKAENTNTADTILGDSDEKRIGITGHSIQGGSFKLKFNSNTISQHNIGKFYCILSWKYKLDNSEDWIDIEQTGHVIYTIPHEPLKAVWSTQNISSKYTPWIEALNYICTHFGSSSGFLSDIDICHETASYINSGNFTYTGGASYSSFNLNVIPKKTIFKAVKFISDLQTSSSTAPLSVNCNDCASINAFFLSLLGIHTDILYLSDIYPFNNGFMCNQILSIGSTTWDIPFSSTTSAGIFRYHAVCSSTTTGALYPITDSCLKVDGGADPWIPDVPSASIKDPTLPLSMNFADPTTDPAHNIPAPPYTNNFYRERLCSNPTGIQECKVVAVSSVLEFISDMNSILFYNLCENDIPQNLLLKNSLINSLSCQKNNTNLYCNYTLNEVYKKREYISTNKLSFTDTLYLDDIENSSVKVSFYNLSSSKEAILLLDNFLNTSSQIYKTTDTLCNLADIAIITGSSEEKFLAFVKENTAVFITLYNNCSMSVFDIAHSIIEQIEQN